MTGTLNCPAVTVLSPSQKRVPLEVALMHHRHQLEAVADHCRSADADDFYYVAEQIEAAVSVLVSVVDTMTAPPALSGGAA